MKTSVRQSKTKCILLFSIFCLGFSSISFARNGSHLSSESERAGNGVPAGSISDLNESILEEKRRNGEIIDEETLRFLLHKNGKNIKTQYLIPTMKAFLKDRNYQDMERKVRNIQSFFKERNNMITLFDSLRESKIVSGECPSGKDFCLPADNVNPFSDTIVDAEQALNSNMDLNTFLAMNLHETIHKFLDHADHGDTPSTDYPFTRYIIKKIVNGAIEREQVFSVTNENSKYWPMLFLESDFYFVQARYSQMFCKYKGYNYGKDIEFKTVSNPMAFEEWIDQNPQYGAVDDEYAIIFYTFDKIKTGRIKYNASYQKPKKFLTSITCVGKL